MLSHMAWSISHNLIHFPQFSMGKYITMATGFHPSLLRQMECLRAHWSANRTGTVAIARLPGSSPTLPPVFLGRHWRHSHDKMDQAFPLCFCILQAIKNWTVGRTLNEATTVSSRKYTPSFCILLLDKSGEGAFARIFSSSRTYATSLHSS